MSSVLLEVSKVLAIAKVLEVAKMLEVAEVMRCVLLCMLEAMKMVLEVAEVMRCVLGTLYAEGCVWVSKLPSWQFARHRSGLIT